MFLTTALLATTLTTKVLAHYDKHESKRLVPMLSEVIRFPTDENNAEGHAAQKVWLLNTAKQLGFVARDAGKITEIELPGPAGAPVLGLVIHGDVQPVDADAWSFAPFGGEVKDGYVLGRGAADDKGPLVQALLAMKALKESGAKRTHTIRLLVGSEEESAAGEIAEYLKTHAPPDYSLVLDSEFPVVVGEKAWDGIAVAATTLADRGESELPYTVASLDAGLSPSIVPDRAEIKLRWKPGQPLNWDKTITELTAVPMPEGTRLVAGPSADADVLRVVVYGKSAHAGVNITGGRNALVALARALEGKVPRGGAGDLLSFARVAGQDLYGTGLGITSDDPIWGRYAVNVATVKPAKDDPKKTVLFINLRRTPPRDAKQSKAHLEQFIRDFNARTGASLTVIDAESYFEDEPLAFDPNAKLVRRLMQLYARATGEKQPKPAISGGGTYAKRLPNSIAFGMWFPGKPYPGHDLDEKIPIDDLQRGARVLIHALTDLATGAKIEEPFKP
ncbi:MAG TPA: Sapep family Mn(2+)-dependent dipeptidase [Thermoanaerobaculia bacterium]|nr:Sapep family Mn(2+)-dependent dipeptidase [Thermoanaerobaculia bacterium]